MQRENQGLIGPCRCIIKIMKSRNKSFVHKGFQQMLKNRKGPCMHASCTILYSVHFVSPSHPSNFV